ncbi:hypothetical protein ACFYYR_23430 [Streptomyces sp. NPDC001922]|uniref:hypothetical protein n=1 Tax=Streptomyces sp. NPDC001922 TaxID=3364624 RepID=UPI0036960CE3
MGKRGRNRSERQGDSSSQQAQVFVGASGLRRRLLWLTAVAVGCACAGYLLLMIATLFGVLQPDPQSPRTFKPPAPASTVRGAAPQADVVSYGTTPTEVPAARKPPPRQP